MFPSLGTNLSGGIIYQLKNNGSACQEIIMLAGRAAK